MCVYVGGRQGVTCVRRVRACACLSVGLSSWLAGCVSMHLDSLMSFSLHLAFIAVIAKPKSQHQTRRQDRPSVKRTTHSATSQVRPRVERTTHSATSQGQAKCSRNHTLSDITRTCPVFKGLHIQRCHKDRPSV